MAIKQVRGKLSWLSRLAILVMIILYATSFLMACKSFGLAIYSEAHPGVTVSHMNLRETHKLKFPSLQLCSLPRQHIYPLKCLIEDKVPPGQHPAMGGLAPSGTECEFKEDFVSSDGKTLCWRIDPNFNASSSGRFSAVLVSVGTEHVDPVLDLTHKVDAFNGVDGILVHIFDSHETPPPFSGSLVLPVGVASEVGLRKDMQKFPVSGRTTQVHYSPTSSFSMWAGQGAGELHDKDNGFDAYAMSATRFFYTSLSTAVESEVNEYTFQNALGDSSGISGFLVGFAFWGGPAFATAIWTGCGGRQVTLIGW